MAAGTKTLPDILIFDSSPDAAVIRILLMGRNSSGNLILGEKRFKRHESGVCEGQTQIRGQQVAVIDCPDLLDPDLNEEQLEMMEEQLFSGCSAGLSSVLLTVPLEKPLQYEQEILDYIKCLFGAEVQKYIMILFTHEDDLEDLDQTVDEYLKPKDHEDLQRLVTECGGKSHCFSNKRESHKQVQDLLQKIEGMMTENGGTLMMKQMQRSNSMDVLNVSFSGKSLPYPVSR
ncbi:GTPase IMAP family member 9-like isoform X1 [Cyprinus carpio]|uniref:GTPase IMAP family member 9-like isoform X1 n=2 Tax=Cyprinus carpio TaxID=7962 RepID=A0A9Q9VYQ2_CYPCA|nr:GTPase IMAP family member 9-like isoform X1 [Cyprinus carpio]XP_042573653.1 GTPase IMAP family member 9-like isoform X1 [Cyprinus carpio]